VSRPLDWTLTAFAVLALIVGLHVLSGCAYTRTPKITQVTVLRVAEASVGEETVKHEGMSPGMSSVLGGLGGWLAACVTTGACW